MSQRKSLRVLAAFLCLSVCVGVLPVQAAQDEPLRFWVASDTHYYSAADLGEMQDKYAEHMLSPDLFGYVSTQGQMQYESRAIVQSFLDDFVRSDAQYLLLPGDLTGGKRQSHLEFAAMLREAQTKSGKPIFVINGNHDCEKTSDEKKISMEEFREIYREFGYDRALERDTQSASYTARLDRRRRLLAIDSCIYGADEGEINRSVLSFIRRELRRAKADDVELIAMMHHSILPHYTLQPMIPRYVSLASLLADNGVRLVLTGHIHANDITSRQTLRGSTLYDVQTGSLITAPNAYRRICVRDQGIGITSGYITRIDASLLPPGFTPQQKARMRTDFPAYARDYLESGVCKFLNRNIGSAWRVARLLKLREGSDSYNAADKVMHKIGDAIGLDLYGTDKSTIESVLAPFGVAIPQSRYQKPYQPAAHVMYGFFHGDESDISDPTDVTLVRLSLEGAVLYAMQTALTNGEQDNLVAALNRAPHAAGCRTQMRIAAEKFADALLRTLAGGFCEDYSAPADVEWTIGSESAAVPLLPGRRLWETPLRFLQNMRNSQRSAA